VVFCTVDKIQITLGNLTFGGQVLKFLSKVKIVFLILQYFPTVHLKLRKTFKLLQRFQMIV